MFPTPEVIKDEILHLRRLQQCPNDSTLGRWCTCICTQPDGQLATDTHDWLKVVEYLYNLLDTTARDGGASKVPDRWLYLQRLLTLLDKVDHAWIQYRGQDGVPLGVTKGVAAIQLLFAVESSMSTHRAWLMRALSEQLRELYRIPSTAQHLILKLFENNNLWLRAIADVVGQDQEMHLDVVTPFASILAQAYETARDLISSQHLYLSQENIEMLVDICTFLRGMFQDDYEHSDDAGYIVEEPELSTNSYADYSSSSQQYQAPQQFVLSSTAVLTQGHLAPQQPYYQMQGRAHAVGMAQQFHHSSETSISGNSQATTARLFDLTDTSMAHANMMGYYSTSSAHDTQNSNRFAYNGYSHGYGAAAPEWQYPRHVQVSGLALMEAEYEEDDCGDNFEQLTLGGQIRGVERQGRGATPPTTASSTSSASSIAHNTAHRAASDYSAPSYAPTNPSPAPPPVPPRAPAFSASHSSTPRRASPDLPPQQHPTAHTQVTQGSIPSHRTQPPAVLSNRPAGNVGMPLPPSAPHSAAPAITQLPPLPAGVIRGLLHPSQRGSAARARRPAASPLQETPFARSQQLIHQNIIAELPPVRARPVLGMPPQQSGDHSSWGPATPGTADTAVRIASDNNSTLPPSHSLPHDFAPPVPFPKTAEIPPTTAHLPPSSPHRAENHMYPPIHYVPDSAHHPAGTHTGVAAFMNGGNETAPTAEILDTASNQQFRVQGGNYHLMPDRSTPPQQQPTQRLHQRPTPPVEVSHSQGAGIGAHAPPGTGSGSQHDLSSARTPPQAPTGLQDDHSARCRPPAADTAPYMPPAQPGSLYHYGQDAPHNDVHVSDASSSMAVLGNGYEHGVYEQLDRGAASKAAFEPSAYDPVRGREPAAGATPSPQSYVTLQQDAARAYDQPPARETAATPSAQSYVALQQDVAHAYDLPQGRETAAGAPPSAQSYVALQQDATRAHDPPPVKETAVVAAPAAQSMITVQQDAATALRPADRVPASAPPSAVGKKAQSPPTGNRTGATPTSSAKPSASAGEGQFPWMRSLSAEDQLSMLTLLTGYRSGNEAVAQDVRQRLPPAATVTAVVQLLHPQATTEEVQRAALQLAVQWGEIDALLAHMREQKVCPAIVKLLFNCPPDVKQLALKFMELMRKASSGLESQLSGTFSVTPYHHILELIPSTNHEAADAISAPDTALSTNVAAALGSLLLLSCQGPEVKRAFINSRPNAALYFSCVQLVLNESAPDNVRQLAADLVLEWFDCVDQRHHYDVVGDLMLHTEWYKLGVSLLEKTTSHAGVNEAAAASGPDQAGTSTAAGADTLVNQLGGLKL